MRGETGALGTLALVLAAVCACACAGAGAGAGAGATASLPVVVEVAPATSGVGGPATTAPGPSATASTPPVVVGQETAEGQNASPKDIAEARRLFQEGKVFFDRADYPHALERFVEAQHLVPRPATLYDIGRTLELMSRTTEAADVYELYLRTDLSHMDRMSMELRIKQLRATP